MDKFMQAAIDEAKLGLAEGGIPIGSVLVHNGEIIGRGHNKRVQSGSPILHGEMDALGRGDDAIAGERELKTPSKRQPMQSSDDGFVATLQIVEQLVSVLGERDDAIEVARVDVADEESNIRARDERLARTGEDDPLDRVVGRGLFECLVELADDGLV